MLVFTYGTLKRGQTNAVLLEKAVFVGHAITNRKYRMLDSGFPVLLEPTELEPGHHVEGEVYDIDKAILARLDSLEGKGRMYDRVRAYVKMSEGSVRLNYYVGIAGYWHSRAIYGGFHTPNDRGALNWPHGRPARAA